MWSNFVVGLGTSTIADLILEAGKSIVQRIKTKRDWEAIFVNKSEVFVKEQNKGGLFIEELSEVLSNANMEELATILKSEKGYHIKEVILNFLMELMDKYDIPHDIALSYASSFLYIILEEIQKLEPEVYDRFFIRELSDNQSQHSEAILSKINAIQQSLEEYKKQSIDISTAEELDLNLKRKTINPRIGISFFAIDDEAFREDFDEKRFEESIYVKARSREEAIYCLINELWRIGDERAILVVQSLESWEKLRNIASSNNIYIPWFYADEIIAIENNTNIFVCSDEMPVFSNDAISLRPRTFSTIAKSLINAGMETQEANLLVSETHGLFIPMKKRIFNGLILKKPRWETGLSDNVKKTCLLLGQWRETEGDINVIEKLSKLTYEDFVSAISKYTKDEEPLVYIINRNGEKSFFLSNVENTWEYVSVSIDEPIWDTFIQLLRSTIIEPEKLLISNSKERLLAEFRGEKLYWSSNIRKGMLRTLIMIACYTENDQNQHYLDALTADIFKEISNVNQWKLIAPFFQYFCEISPNAVLNCLNQEFVHSTGLLELFKNQSSDFIFKKNDYIDILFGIEQLLTQKEYAPAAFEWLLKLDDLSFDYKSNNPQDIFDKLFCVWYNFSAFQTVEEKKILAEKAFALDHNAWDIIYKSIPTQTRSIIGGLCHPQYRLHEEEKEVTLGEINNLTVFYLDIIIKHTEFEPDRWNKLLDVIDDFGKAKILSAFESLLFEITQMTDQEIIQIKDKVREIIYNHRYYASSTWAMKESEISVFEQLLSDIHTVESEYEYKYLFASHYDCKILNPIPYNQESKRDENSVLFENEIKDKVHEFKERGLNLQRLVEICADNRSNSLGQKLGKYWSNTGYDNDVFEILLNIQKTGEMAVDYYQTIAANNLDVFSNVLEAARKNKCPNDVLAELYSVESRYTSGVPQIANADETIKKIYWKRPLARTFSDYKWAVKECRKYGTLSVYIELLFMINHQYHLDIDELYEYCLFLLEDNQIDESITSISFQIQQLLMPLQEQYLKEPDKCSKLCRIEMKFFGILKFEDMRCLQHEIKQSPLLYTDLLANVFKKDSQNEVSKEDSEEIQRIKTHMFRLFDSAKFCPGEEDGIVNEDKLNTWIQEFKKILSDNDQSSLFSFILGKLFAFAPIGEDGYAPCEAVRNYIEKNANKTLIREYQAEEFNKRGVFTPSAGKGEYEIALMYKETADYFQLKYPKTATIFYGLYRSYKSMSEQERADAENGWF